MADQSPSPHSYIDHETLLAQYDVPEQDIIPNEELQPPPDLRTSPISMTEEQSQLPSSLSSPIVEQPPHIQQLEDVQDIAIEPITTSQLARSQLELTQVVSNLGTMVSSIHEQLNYLTSSSDASLAPMQSDVVSTFVHNRHTASTPLPPVRSTVVYPTSPIVDFVQAPDVSNPHYHVTPHMTREELDYTQQASISSYPFTPGSRHNDEQGPRHVRIIVTRDFT
jgi:hypothetical protein